MTLALEIFPPGLLHTNATKRRLLRLILSQFMQTEAVRDWLMTTLPRTVARETASVSVRPDASASSPQTSPLYPPPATVA
jgi:hypothetical protein